MYKLKKTLALVLIMLLLASVLTACQSSTNEGNSATTEDDNSDIIIACLAPFSGNYTQYGEGYKAAIEMKLKEYNDAGGYNGRKVVCKYFDDKCDAKEAVTVAQKIINDDEILITLGPWSSTVGFAVGPMFGKAEMGLYGISTSHTDFVAQNDYMVRKTPRIGQFYEAAAKLYYEELGFKKAAFLHYVDDTANAAAAQFKETFEALGGNVALIETYMTGAVDFSAQLTKIIAAKPDVIQTFGSYADTAKIIQQARNLDYKGIIGLSGASYNQGLIELAKEQAEGCMAIVHIDPDHEQAIALDKKFNEFSGKSLDAHSYMAHDAVWHVLQALDAVGPDRQAIIEYLRNDKEAQGTFGNVVYTDGEPQAPVFPVTIKDGRFCTFELNKLTLESLMEPVK